MNIQDFSNIILTLFSFVSCVLIGNLWFTFFPKGNNSIKVNNNIQSKDYSLLYLSGALLIWSISYLIKYYFELHNFNEINTIILTAISSSLNNLFLLIAASNLEFSPKWILKYRSRYRIIYIILSIIVIIVTIALFGEKKDRLTISFPDFILSTMTAILLGYSIVNTFRKRKLIIISIFSFFTLFLLLFCQSTIKILLDNNFEKIFDIIGLFSRLSFVIMICLLAYSWAQSNYNSISLTVSELEEKIKGLDEKLASSENEVRIAKEIVQKDERDSAWQDIAFKAAHKIGNPIDAIDGFKETIKKRLYKQEYKEIKLMLAEMEGSIEEAKNVLNEFKSLTKLFEMKLIYADLMKIIRKASMRIESDRKLEIEIEVNLLSEKATPISITTNNNTLKLNVVAIDETLDLFIDKEKIKHCFDELITDSVHFFNKDKKDKKIIIEVKYLSSLDKIPNKLSDERQYIKINYKDNGIGIPTENKTKIFQPFYTTYQHGTGLGLSIVERIIELHEGLIIENGIEGNGVNFEIYLPTDLKIKNN